MASLQNFSMSRDGLAKVLCDHVLFVPTYQRSYAWTERHVTSLFDDISREIQRRAGGSQGVYFLGSIVAIDRKQGGGLEIVDGQQRLATIAIFLAAVRDHFLSVGDDEGAHELERRYLTRLDLKTRLKEPRLRMNEVDNLCFVQRVITEPKSRPKAEARTPSNRRIQKAYRIARDRVTAIAQAAGQTNAIDALLRWVDFLRDNAQVIRVTVDDDADAFVIFETLNDRGLPLSVSDLLKNYLFGLAGERIEESKRNWQSMAAALETITKKDIAVEYVRQLWASMHGIVRRKDLFEDIKGKVKNTAEAVVFANELSENARGYAAILNSGHEMWGEYGGGARESITSLRELRMERVRPLLLAVVNSFTPAESTKVLRYLVGASVRLIIAGGPAGTVESAFALAAVKIRQKQITNAKQLASELNLVVPNDATFETAFKTARVSKESLARYYLRTLENELSASAGRVVTSDERKMTLEHVLPLKARGRAWDHLPYDKADELARRIGNMTLLTSDANSTAGSKSFEDKLEVYNCDDSLAITKEIVEKYSSGKWDEAAIRSRQESMAKLAVSAWSIRVK